MRTIGEIKPTATMSTSIRANKRIEPKRILRTIAYADADIDKIPYEQSDYDTPDRDFVFFDRLFVRTLTFLLQGLAKNDPKMLAKSNVKHADVVSLIPRINQLVQKTR